MLDGPKIGLLVLAIVLPLVILGIYLVERRHGGRGRRREREPQRLPLFGTDQLAIRSADGTFEEEEDDAPRRPIPPISHAPQVAAPKSVVPASSNGRSYHAPPPPAAPLRPPTPRDGYHAMPAPAASAITATAERPSVPAPRPLPTPAGMPDLALIEGETLRFAIPTDGAVEFIPGRLEIVAGPEAGREIRFVRTTGEENVEVTFGRSEGPPNRHVQILARTVSRRHAVMSLIDEHWQLTNLSSTNPVVLNGRVLAGNEVAPLLVEGDRIEMGEVAFVFHDD
ncbi:Forkhead-associated protein [Gemmatirosa kalamazoonensis]|uniref:Forkhead-associated protein n=1 Tax=Gemmatirosa kalamazoonensis TaxID=861299 RepID=W0RLT7_9BACT|nr:FHA domain-containing protein [Gemmatirosa kalamazoonensis]AHG91275.1 Forkhead-associated protein [Gemmatirosa kalamazoonensis]